jgi:ppGpp synthetase/RelA/SpoT-type nucleotidyltranferase
MSPGDRTVDDWLAVYDEVRPTYRALVDKLQDLLEELFEAEDVDYEWTTTWLASRGRFEDSLCRALRNGEEIEDPFRDLPDFAGVTVIVSALPEIDAVADLVERELDVDHDASVSAEAAETRREDFSRKPPLGYEGVRYATQITSGRAQLTEWKPYRDLRAQVEVQTVLQHAWEMLDQNLPYYEGSSYPPTARLDLGDLEGLIAAADRQHEQVWGSLDEEHKRYQELVGRRELDLELNGESVAAYLDSSDTVAALVEAALAAGFRPTTEPFEPDRTALEQQTLWLFRCAEFRTLAELDAFLANAKDRAREILGDIATISIERDFQPWALRESIVEWLVLVLQRADAELVELMRYRDEVAAALNTLIGNPVGEPGE